MHLMLLGLLVAVYLAGPSAAQSSSVTRKYSKVQALINRNQAHHSPKFMVPNSNIKVTIGDTLNLPCEVDDLGPFILLWRRGQAVLTAADLMVARDKRYQLVSGYNLRITNVEPQDAGDYVCQVSDREGNDLVHTVEIQVPPSIRPHPESGEISVEEGTSVSLECKASGNPVPVITWTRKGHSHHVLKEGQVFTLENIVHHEAGVYQCTASNGVGEPVVLDMKVNVTYQPVIEVERTWVHSGKGLSAQLVCVVHGFPEPDVFWFQDSILLQNDDRHFIENTGNKYVLNIFKVQPDDFGNYSCRANSSAGREKKILELTGVPAPAEFRSEQFSRTRDAYNLTWTVDSYLPLQEVRLLYRKVEMNSTMQKVGTWHDVILSPRNGHNFTHTMHYELRGLDPGSVFEALVQTRNQYGWSKVSETYQFYTKNVEPDSANALDDSEDYKYSDRLSSSASTASFLFQAIASLLTSLLFLISAYL